jgi:hypothetical protein
LSHLSEFQILINARKKNIALSGLKIPCGQCIGCRLEYSRQWAMRCHHEASLHIFNSFITLTYDPEHLPQDGSLKHLKEFNQVNNDPCPSI